MFASNLGMTQVLEPEITSTQLEELRNFIINFMDSKQSVEVLASKLPKDMRILKTLADKACKHKKYGFLEVVVVNINQLLQSDLGPHDEREANPWFLGNLPDLHDNREVSCRYVKNETLASRIKLLKYGARFPLYQMQGKGKFIHVISKFQDPNCLQEHFFYSTIVTTEIALLANNPQIMRDYSEGKVNIKSFYKDTCTLLNIKGSYNKDAIPAAYDLLNNTLGKTFPIIPYDDKGFDPIKYYIMLSNCGLHPILYEQSQSLLPKIIRGVIIGKCSIEGITNLINFSMTCKMINMTLFRTAFENVHDLLFLPVDHMPYIAQSLIPMPYKLNTVVSMVNFCSELEKARRGPTH